MADNPLDDLLGGLAQTAQQAGQQLAQGDLAGAAETVVEGVGDAAGAVGEAIDEAVDVPEVSTEGELGVDVLGQHIGVGGSLQISDEGASLSIHSESPLGSRDTSAQVDESGASVSTQGAGVLGSADASVGIGSDGITADYQETLRIGVVELSDTGASVSIDEGGVSAEAHHSGLLANVAGVEVEINESGLHYEAEVEEPWGDSSAEWDVSPQEVSGEWRAYPDLGIVSADLEGSFHAGGGGEAGAGDQAEPQAGGAGTPDTSAEPEVELMRPGLQVTADLGLVAGMSPGGAGPSDSAEPPTVVAAAETPTAAYVPGEEAPAAGEPAEAVAAEVSEPGAVLWEEGGQAAGSGLDEATAAAEEAGTLTGEDEEGGLGDMLSRAAEAVGDFIEDVVEKIGDVFDGDD